MSQRREKDKRRVLRETFIREFYGWLDTEPKRVLFGAWHHRKKGQTAKERKIMKVFVYNEKGELHNVVPHVLKLDENEHCWSMYVKPSDGEETADRFIYSKPEYHCEVLC